MQARARWEVPADEDTVYFVSKTWRHCSEPEMEVLVAMQAAGGELSPSPDQLQRLQTPLQGGPANAVLH